MSQYVAVLRLSDDGRSITAAGGGGGGGGASAGEVGVGPRLLRLAGVETIQVDRVAGSLLVWFNRSQVSLADIVRTLEDAGIAVLGVAQGRADVGEHMKAAIA